MAETLEFRLKYFQFQNQANVYAILAFHSKYFQYKANIYEKLAKLFEIIPKLADI